MTFIEKDCGVGFCCSYFHNPCFRLTALHQWHCEPCPRYNRAGVSWKKRGYGSVDLFNPEDDAFCLRPAFRICRVKAVDQEMYAPWLCFPGAGDVARVDWRIRLSAVQPGALWNRLRPFFPMVSATIADLFSGNKRAAMMGIKSAVGSIFSIAMQMLSGYLVIRNWRLVFLEFLTAVPVFFLVLLFLPDTGPKEGRNAAIICGSSPVPCGWC